MASALSLGQRTARVDVVRPVRMRMARALSTVPALSHWSPFLSTTSLQSITLMRHAESLGNIGEQSAQEVGDHNLSLSLRGHHQARETGRRLGRQWFLPDDSPRPLVYCSPYKRTRDTMDNLLRGAGLERRDVEVRKDIRLRETEFGPGEPHHLPIPQQETMRETHGWLFYRFMGGESPADCFDRCSSFLGTLHRQLCRAPTERALILSHGLTIRCFLTRFFHLSVDQFDAMENPLHCSEIEIVRGGQAASDECGRLLVRPSSTWGLRGIKLRKRWLDRSHEWRAPLAPPSTATPAAARHSTPMTEGLTEGDQVETVVSTGHTATMDSDKVP